jgi:hypothetical protein
LEKQFTLHDLCDVDRERWVEARVQALLESIGYSPPNRVRPCDIPKLITFLKLVKGLWNL